MAHGESPRHQPRKRPRPSQKTSNESRSRPKAAARAGDSAPPRRISPPTGTGAKGAAYTAYAGSIRLQKLLASAGFGSRRDVERFLTEERVTVNGRVAKLGDRADPSVDEIRFDGERLLRERPTYWIVNKPRGVVTTVRDDEGRRTIVDLLPRSVGRLFPVGRLDRETTGLVLMTNDGDAAHVLLHPSLGNEREYRVNVKGHLDRRAITRLERGITFEEGRTSPARVADVRYDADSGTSSLTLTLSEGKKRQIRRSLLVLGFPVRRLVRVRMGPLKIGRLAVGEARPLRSEERRALLEHVRRLRAGEVPVVSAAGGKDTRRGGASRKSPVSRKGGAARKSGAGRGATTGRRTRASRDRDSDPLDKPIRKATKRPVGKPGSKPRSASKPRKSSKPAARKSPGSRKPSPRGGQRTASSRKGVRK